MVLPTPFPPDIRVEKEAKALINSGHEVHLVCMNKGMQPYEDVFDGIQIHRFEPRSERYGKLSALITIAFFLNPIWFKSWYKKIQEIVQTYDIDVLHIHDLPLVIMGIFVGKKERIPVIFDMHENWPEALRVWGKSHYHDWLFSSVILHKMLERICIKYSDHIIVVVNEQKERLVKLGVPDEKITIIMNTEDLNNFLNIEIDKELVDTYKNKFVVSYIGGFGLHRGLDAAIKAMPKIIEKIPNTHLLLVGDGTNRNDLEKLSEKLGIRDHVIFTGRVDFKYVPSYIALSDMCLVPHHASGHTNTTIPHKLFQYMAMRKPAIVTDAKPLKRVAEETECGIVVPSGNYNEMADAVIKLYKDKEYAKILGENGRKAVEEKYNWKNEAKALCELYERLGEKYGRV